MARTEGHRERLLEAAKQLLTERGYARTTARDLVAASGTNLASIGYHFGSKEALLTEALFASLDELDQQFDRNQAAAAATDPPETPVDVLRTTWEGVIESFTSHHAVWIASLEAFAQIEHLPDLRQRMSDLYEQMRGDMADLARAMDPEAQADDTTARAFGSFHLALMAGLTLQWMIDPERAPSADDLVAGLQSMVRIVGDA
ncbi:MAG TPA: TetR/AcrR family transcriptional regulator [Acidimicrobiales bacterium]|nr:TetR/AcrR family transcriptional regulator [Acidimicrobiales bacterium]